MLVRLELILDCEKGLVADHMLDLTGILRCGSFVDTHTDQQTGQYRVAFKDLPGNSLAFLGQMQKALIVGDHIAALLQQAHSPADAGLGVAHMLRNIDAADICVGLGEHVDGFEIHLTGFL